MLPNVKINLAWPYQSYFQTKRLLQNYINPDHVSLNTNIYLLLDIESNHKKIQSITIETSEKHHLVVSNLSRHDRENYGHLAG